MKIVSWNVNGLRAAHRKGFLDWLGAANADLVGVQEVRALEEQLEREVRSPRGWHSHFSAARRKGYSGVGIYSRNAFLPPVTTLGVRSLDAEGRVQIARVGKLTVVNAYFPNGNGKNRDLSRIPFKLRFYRRLFEALEPAFTRGERLLVMGDFNTAHQEIDLARPRDNVHNSGFTARERATFDRWIRAGWVDTFRAFEQGTGHYSWWSQRIGVRERNIGWRLDYVLASPSAMDFVREAKIHPEVRGSDHCPVSVTLDPRVL